MPTEQTTDGPTAGTSDQITAHLTHFLHRKTFSAAAWSFGDATGVRAGGHLGTFTADGEPIDSDALFDLASMTKPFTALCVLRLLEQGRLSLTETVADHLPHLADRPVGAATLRSLLTHTSGIAGAAPLYRACRTREDLLTAITSLPLQSPGVWAYSCLGFIVLGEVVAAVADTPLDEAVRELVTGPLGMTDTGYLPVDADRCVATEQDPWRGRMIRGEVHDENAHTLGGVAGNAGIFGTIGDVSMLATALTAGLPCPVERADAPFLHPATVTTMAGLNTVGEPIRPLGWWSRSQGVFMGDLVGPRSFGHTGFTGTSLVIDPDAGRWYCLLTNRVHPTREPRGFDLVRRRFHNLCVVA